MGTWKEMIGSKWLPRSKKFKCALDKKWHLTDIHNNGKQTFKKLTGKEAVEEMHRVAELFK